MKKGFSLVELLISLIVVSILLSTLAPVISKKLKNSSISLSQMSEITTECENSNCELCTKKYCIKCGLDSCTTGQYANTKKCECSSCSDWDSNCVECDSKACTKCRDGYYIKDGKCAACPTGGCCDGVRVYTTIPSGYYCDKNVLYKCSEKYQTACATCDNVSCRSCNIYYYLSNGECKSCNIYTQACLTCQNENYCTECQGDWVLDTSSHKCSTMCKAVIEGCLTCANDKICSTCNTKYFLNTSKTCTKCSVENCKKCKDGVNSAICESCLGGYYLSNGACKSCSNYDSNCAACDSNECLSCNQGYHLENAKCVSNDNKFNCSDSNFMAIGSLCVTRKNMGDSATLKIPSTVTVVDVGEYCYATNSKCCWKGKTASPCDSENGDYSGCNRTLCNWDAAKEICAKFNYQGKTWRLPTPDETKKWGEFSLGLESRGLQLCDAYDGFNSARCWQGNCPGSRSCAASYVWNNEMGAQIDRAYRFELTSGLLNQGNALKDNTISTRCVSEL